ncbi:hypothetical protein HID58_096198, partial [Brassica napus]
FALKVQSSSPASNTLKQLSHGSDGDGAPSFITPALVSSVATPPSSRSAAVSAFSGAVRSSLSATVFVVSCASSHSARTTRFAAVFVFSGAVPSSLPARTTGSSRRFIPPQSGNSISKSGQWWCCFFVFFGATRFGSKSLYPNLLVRVCGIITVLRPFIPSLQVLTHILTLKPPSRMATKKSGGGGLPVSASDTSFAYGLLSPVVYRYLFGCVDDTSFAYWLHFPVIYRSLFGCFDLHTSRPCKVLHAHHSSLFTIYSATVKWFRQLSVWVMLELRFMILAGDIPMGLVSFGSTFSIYIALARASAVCSSLMGFIPDVGVVFVEEKFIVIFIPMNMDVAGFNFPLVPRLNQSFFLIFLPIWSKLDEQVSLVLQGSSSHRMLFSAYGAVCVVLRVTLDAVFKEAYDVVVVQISGEGAPIKIKKEYSLHLMKIIVGLLQRFQQSEEMADEAAKAGIVKRERSRSLPSEESISMLFSTCLLMILSSSSVPVFAEGLTRKPMALIKKLRKAKRDAPAGEKPEAVRTHLRNMIIVPEMIGSIIGVYNGKTFNQVEVKPEMIGHYLAEFSISYKPVKHGRPGVGATNSSRFIPLK